MSQMRMQALFLPRASSASAGAPIGLASAAAMAPLGSDSFGIAPLRMTVGRTPAGTVTGRWPLPNSRSIRDSVIARPRRC